jgi:class 3 adenylate cyclase
VTHTTNIQQSIDDVEQRRPQKGLCKDGIRPKLPSSLQIGNPVRPHVSRHGDDLGVRMRAPDLLNGLLAIFSMAPDSKNAREICNAALAAAREARAAVASSFVASEERGSYGVRFGLALHLGQVMYGNIGSGNRLDFTCVGPAVNLAARIENLTGKLQRTVLASDEFAGQCPSEFVPVGEFDLAGFATARAVFGLHDEAG